jgi:hypothetical protein
MQVDLVVKCLHYCQHTYQHFGAKLGDWATLGHDVPIPKICSKISKAIEDPLKEVSSEGIAT